MTSGDFSTSTSFFIDKMYKKTDITILESNLKSYHTLPGPVPLRDNIMPTIIIEFVHFNDKTEIYKNRRMLKSMNNEISKKYLMKERLPPLDALVKKLAEKQPYSGQQ